MRAIAMDPSAEPKLTSILVNSFSNIQAVPFTNASSRSQPFNFPSIIYSFKYSKLLTPFSGILSYELF